MRELRRGSSRNDFRSQRAFSASHRNLDVCLFVHFISGISNMNKADLQEDLFDITCRMDWIG